ncbi:hypothetical protein DID88_009738 [Monilinia fructigena]|uniref:Alpha-1,3-glucosyltransferase n=1 Tax=Monilinia fructigena TaxID=38457 RepID=A0A395IJJ3_9HELO|nr:hypothetical protein DID88_009738 [Monilinia fructigena]
MAEIYPSIAQCAVVATAFKILLFPAYKSTDFEVHRNWLAITNTLPLNKWYIEKTSEWTLDYPPFFAYFELFLSQFAEWIDPLMLSVKNLEYASWQTIYFQRASVIATELVLVYALHLFVKTAPTNLKRPSQAAALSILLSPGLLIIDHIHFQYNGFILFPFGRGLCHAYWAPNIWALYSFTDRALISIAPKLGLAVDSAAINSVTRGLVGNTSFAVLPEITKGMTFILTAIFDFIPLFKLYKSPTWDNFIGGVTLCAYSSFLFSWHVHEKAILLVIIPFSLIALKDRRFLGAFRPLAVAGHVSLFPLLFTAAEFPIKTIYTHFWLVLFLLAFDRFGTSVQSQEYSYLIDLAHFIIAISIPLNTVLFACSINFIFGNKLEFFTVDVYELIFSNWSCGKLDRIFDSIF